jgi:hypothetical protein
MDLRAAKILSHRRNIQRYSQLLAMDIRELEREYLHKRIVEEQTELEHWELRSEEAHESPLSLPHRRQVR